MKKILTATLTLVAFTCLGAVPGAHAQQRSVHPEGIYTNVPRPPVTTLMPMQGRVSENGKILVSDKDGVAWTINNPRAVRHYRGEHVSVCATQSGRDFFINVDKVNSGNTPARCSEEAY